MNVLLWLCNHCAICTQLVPSIKHWLKVSMHSLTESLTACRLLYQKATLFSSAPSLLLFTVPVDFRDPQAVASFCFLISSLCVWSSESPFPPPEKLTVSKSIHIESSFSLISEWLSKPSVITIAAPEWTLIHTAHFDSLLQSLTSLGLVYNGCGLGCDECLLSL